MKENTIMPFLSNTTNMQNTSLQNDNNTIYYVSITSQFPGQPQMLTIPENGSGFFMYPYWTFRFFSDVGQNNQTKYTIYVNGMLLHSGTFYFTTAYSVNMSFNMVNISIVLQSNKSVQIWNYHMIPILHSTLANYYKSTFVEKPIYTITQYLQWGGEIFVATLLVLLASYYVIYKTYVAKKEEEPQQIV
ncbi:MAG: hypothetical protein ACP5L4_02055 [Thermoplasmata archaeon]